MIKGIIFDADGTLLDSLKIWEGLGQKYLLSLGIKGEEGLSKILFDMTLDESCAYLKKRYNLKAAEEEVKCEIVGFIKDFYEKEVTLKNGVADYLKFIKEKGINAAIATSGEAELVKISLKRLGVYDYFAVINSCAEHGASKREPFIYIKTAEDIGTNPEETMVFEDVEDYINTAKEAGFITVGVQDDLCRNKHIKDACHIYIDDFYDSEIRKI